MSPHAPSTDPATGSDIQRIILSTRIGCIASELSSRLCISPAEALLRFYDSRTCALLHDKRSGLHLCGDLYVVDEFLLEMGLHCPRPKAPCAQQHPTAD